MLGFDPSNDQQPVTWWRGHPIHAAMLLVIIHVAAMLVTTFVGLSGLFAYNSSAVLHGAVWQFVTYAFVHPPQGLLWFAIEMYLLWAFGRELERFFGKRAFLQLYFLLLLLTPALLTVIALLGTPTSFYGSGNLHFALFIAFATLYPGAAMLFGITAKWAAIILVAINSLEAIGAGAWNSLIALWVNIGAAILFVNVSRGRIAIPSFNPFKRRPKFRVVPSEPARPQSRSTPRAEDTTIDDIDPLLDKIAKSGINSLTSAERARLERARAALLKKDPGAH